MNTSKTHFYRLIYTPFIIAGLLLGNDLFAAQPQLNAEEIEHIAKDWVCKWCPYEKLTKSGTATVGAGFVTNDSFKHGEYSGLNEEGAYGIADIEYARSDPDGNSADVSATHLGLDSRNVKAEAGLMGKTNLLLLYDELPKFISDTARTPYLGSSVQTLPSGWVTGATTVDMTQLENSLQDIPIKTQRKKIALTANYYQTPELSYRVDFQRETKEGNKTAGLALGSTFATAKSAIIAIPVDYVTSQGTVQLNYVKPLWNVSAGYQFSKFENDNNAIHWQNAFSQPTGVNNGQAAQEPSNNMYQLFLSGAYKFSATTSSSAKIALGKLEQDENFLPYTINSSLSPAALPINSLNADVDIYSSVVTLVSNISEKLRLQAQYSQNEHDNNTDRATFDHVIADTALSSTSRANFPYSFRQREFSANANYAMLKQHSIGLGLNHETNNRTYQEVENSDENGYWGKYRFNLKNTLDISIKYSQHTREGDSYDPVTEISPAENPLLRKYNLANRERSNISSSVTYYAVSSLTLGFTIEISEDDYTDSDLGLTNSEEKDYSFSLQYTSSPTLTTSFDLSRMDISSQQSGSQTYSTPTWVANNDEQVDIVNFGVMKEIYKNRLTLGLNYSYASSRGDITVTTAGSMPSLKTDLHTITLNGDYKLSRKSSVNVLVRYEKYDEENWTIDNVAPNTINNVLTLGEVSPSYDIGIIALGYKLNF